MRSDTAQVWEFDYGERERLLDGLGDIAEFAHKDCVTGLGIYVNNNPYMLETFVTVQLDQTHGEFEFCADFVRLKLSEAGGATRSDVTVHDLNLMLFEARRFNYQGFTDRASVEALRRPRPESPESQTFVLPSRNQLRGIGMSMVPFSPRDRVFLSHQSDRKLQVAELQECFSSNDVQCWLDRDAIKIGDLIHEKIDEGIDQCSAVVFWVSPEFLESSWCKYELSGFLSAVGSIGHDKVRIFPVVEPGVTHDELPRRFRDVRYYRMKDKQSVSELGQELIPDVKSFFARSLRER